MSKIIIITGCLASLKSTIAKRLSKDLNILSLQKDTMKEVLGDHIGFQTREDNLKLSHATFFMMRHIAEKCIEMNQNIIIESNFKIDELQVLRESSFLKDVDILTIFLDGDSRVLYDRYCLRQPQRHSVHTSTGLMSYESFHQAKQTYRKEDSLGKVIRFDTTVFSEDDYLVLLKYVVDFVSQNVQVNI